MGRAVRAPTMFSTLTVALTFCIGAAACDQRTMKLTGQLPFLPVATQMDAMLMARSSGDLVLEDGCIWLRKGQDRLLIVWPPGYEVQWRNGELAMVNQLGEVSALVGNQVDVVGGEWRQAKASGTDIDLEVERRIGRAVPQACRQGAYWLGAVLDSGG